MKIKCCYVKAVLISWLHILAFNLYIIYQKKVIKIRFIGRMCMEI